MIQEILKDYGPAIGPTLAFLFAIIALFVKHTFDIRAQNWILSRRLKNLEKIVTDSAPADEFFPATSAHGLLHADEARNITNLARFYSRLLVLKPMFQLLSEQASEAGTPEQLVKLNMMKWWFDISLNRVEKMRNTEKYRMSRQDFLDIERTWKSLVEAMLSPKEQMKYISTRWKVDPNI